MQRIPVTPRADLDSIASAQGFTFHNMHGEPYWDESSAYAFSLAQIETDIEDPSTELHAMVLEAVGRITGSEELMGRMGIDPQHWDLVAGSFATGEKPLYGRFDLLYDGTGPASMLEYNADTPTALFEAASFQWDWLEDQRELGHVPAGADQFNGIFEALVARWAELLPHGTDLHFAAAEDNPEDYGTVETLAYAARAAGLGAHFVDTGKIGLTTEGQLADDQDRVIGALFKLHPWEDILQGEMAAQLAGSQCRFIEPAWKVIASSKAILPVLWEMFEGHPNLLASFFAKDVEAGTPAYQRALGAGHFRHGKVSKPLFSREGASVTITGPKGKVIATSQNRDYDGHARIIQAYRPMPEFDGWKPVLGSWIVGEACAGLGIREDRDHITQDMSRFKPHYIV